MSEHTALTAYDDVGVRLARSVAASRLLRGCVLC